MKQTKLPFGSPKASRVAKLSSPTRVCVHHNLYTIRFCKRCYTINDLRQRWTSTISVKTGCPLGTCGTKKQLLVRLIKKHNYVKQQCDWWKIFFVWIVYPAFVYLFTHLMSIWLYIWFVQQKKVKLKKKHQTHSHVKATMCLVCDIFTLDFEISFFI